MKNLFTTVFLWAGMFMSFAQAQNYSVDTLRVYNQDLLYAKIVTPQIADLKEHDNWKQLIIAFRQDLESIKSQIPDYSIYEISYTKNYNLQIEEVEGIVKYQVNNGQTSLEHNQNVAMLRDGKLSIYLYFNELEELYTRNYEVMMTSAITKIKKQSILRKVYAPINQYRYSYSDGSLQKGNFSQSKKNIAGLVINHSIGIYKNQPIFEIQYGAGLIFGKYHRQFIYLFGGYIYQFQNEPERHQADFIFGITYKPSRYGNMSIAFPQKNAEVYDDLLLRLTATITPFKRGVLNIHLFYHKDNFYYPSMSLGFGL